MKNRLLLLCLLTVSLLSSCVTPKDTNLLQDNVRKNYLPDFNQSTDYTIIPGDRLSLTIYTMDEDMRKLFSMYTSVDYGRGGSGSGSMSMSASNNTDVRAANVLNVYSDGTIKIPYLNKVSVQNLSLFDAKNMLEAKFQEFSPNITIELRLQNRYFSFLGEASESRISMPSPKITIFQALALAAPLKPFGNMKKVSIVRQTAEGTVVKSFDIRSKDIVNSEYYYIQPNDVIYIEQISSAFFGRVTSFAGVLGLIGILASVTGLVALIVNLTK